MSSSPHELRDSLVADLVAQSEKTTGERMGQAALNLVVPALQELEQKEATRKPANSKGDAAQEQLREEARRQGIAGDVERFSPVQTPRAIRKTYSPRLARRFQWMKRQPEYAKHLEGIAAGMMLGGEMQEKAAQKLRDLLVKSDEQLKRPWHKPEPRKLWLT